MKEFTYGKPTGFFLGMDLGDGLLRHPIALYEVVFLILLFFLIKKLQQHPHSLESGMQFKIFMVAYFAFRFVMEFLKPNTFLILGLSSIQYLCLICFIYYYKTIQQGIIYARKQLYLL